MSGRKKKTIPPAKERRITIRLTEDQYEVIDKNAKLSQLSLSEYIRRCLLNQKIPEYNIIIHDDQEILKELHKINKLGNNINQIAKHLNQGGKMTNPLAAQLKQLHQLLWDTVMKLDAAVEKEYAPKK